MSKYDFVAVGDIVTDAFIELQDAWIETDNPEKLEELCMRFGDKIPYKEVVVVPAVGNSPNAAVSAKRLGLKSALITDMGDDNYGREQMEQLQKEGLDTGLVRIHEGVGSNYHFVLRFKAERTILVKHHEYDYKFPNLSSPKWMYLSSLADNSLPYQEEIADYLEKNSEVQLAFQPGTFQMELGKNKLARLYKLSDVFFCNKEEAQRILDTDESDIKKLLSMMRELGPKTVVITDGPDGAYVFNGEKTLFCPAYPDERTQVDRTGAGDAFASTFVSALALGKTLEEALMWAPINSMAVIQEVGAQKGLLSREKLEEHLKNAPEEYKIKEI